MLTLASCARAQAEPDGLQLMGLVRAQQGRAPEAETLYRRSLSLAPKQPHVQANLGRLLIATGRSAEAITPLRAAVRAIPTMPICGWRWRRHSMQWAILRLRREEPAHGADAAARLRPPRSASAALLNDLGRPREGEEVLRGALGDTNAPPFLMAAAEHNLGVSLKLQRRYREALARFRRRADAGARSAVRRRQPRQHAAAPGAQRRGAGRLSPCAGAIRTTSPCIRS